MQLLKKKNYLNHDLNQTNSAFDTQYLFANIFICETLPI